MEHLSTKHSFKNQALWQQAMTHSSATRDVSNERLEFLGDAVVGLVVSRFLWERFPEVDEGILSRLRSRWVCRENLAACARELKLGADLILGRTEQLSGGREKESILADAFEAYIGAVYLDGGYDAVAKLLHPWLLLEEWSVGESTDPKSQLQEWAQRRYKKVPVYEYTQTKFAAHAPEFRADVFVEDQCVGSAVGATKRSAAKAAAAKALKNVATEFQQ